MEKIVGYLGLFMSAFFVASGIFLIWRRPFGVPAFFESLQDKPHVFYIGLGLILISYGIFRFFRAYNLIRKN